MQKIVLTACLGLSVLSAQAQLNVDLLYQNDYPENMSNIWGWTAPGGEEYVILGSFDGTYLIDITDPSSPDELQFIDGNNSTWRQIAVWDHYAYVVNESGGGLLCIDLSGLPGTAAYAFSDADGAGLTTAHQVWADENGYVYVFGSNLDGGSSVILNANADPMDPPMVGSTDTWYVHHGFARGDTLYESNIYQGWFSVWDVSDKSMPVLLATQETPGTFTHNVVPSDNGQFLFTTDEKSNGSLAAYDISDLSDIQYQSEFRANPGTSSIPHYAWYFDGFVVTAWYKDGVIITDATHPEFMIKTGYYDTHPGSGSGFSGAWGCYPYFPSGTLVVSDISEGFFVLHPTYVHASFVEGTITDSDSGLPVFGATASLLTLSGTTVSSSLDGGYITGAVADGIYTLEVSKAGYATASIPVSLSAGVTLAEDILLEPVTATCESPVILGASSITSSSAYLDWTNVGADQYSVIYKKVGGSGTIHTTTATNYLATGLESCSTYKWAVRASCPDGSKKKSVFGTFFTGGASCRDGALTVVEDISVFPNPAAGIITVVVADEADITSLLVLDVLGNMVLQATVSADNFGMVQLDCSALAAGSYRIIAETGEQFFTAPLQVIH